MTITFTSDGFETGLPLGSFVGAGEGFLLGLIGLFVGASVDLLGVVNSALTNVGISTGLVLGSSVGLNDGRLLGSEVIGDGAGSFVGFTGASLGC